MNQQANPRPQSSSSPSSHPVSDSKDSFQISAPSISLPKGGGAIRGIGEKFAANPVMGTGSMTVPIATSPGRSGFGPQLSLSYDSGSGNGPFGFGWSLSLPSITRKTDKGLPKYQDAVESDIFILSGAEDLVPTLIKDAQEHWVREVVPHRTVNNQVYRIQRYRPRIEGLFARIERWTNSADSTDVFWRSVSKDNITTWYGKTDESRIFDANDKSRIFSWLICQTYDDKGNVNVYEYKEEDSEKVNVARAHERNRTPATRATNRYLKRICYGNRQPYLPRLTPADWPQPAAPRAVNNAPNYFFEVVFDYDDGHYPNETTDAEGRVFANPVYSPPAAAKWKARFDSFSTYRAGFEVRTYRLCQRVLMFHHFPDELNTSEYLVRSTDFTYSSEDNPNDARNPIYSFLNSVSQSGYVRQANGSYLKKSLPPLHFEYTRPEVQAEVRDIDRQSLENLPYGLDNSTYQWVDLDGEGLAGILTEQADGWFYKRNLSPLPIKTNGKEQVSARFAPLELVARKPAIGLAGGAQFLDLAGDGQVDLVQMEGPSRGFYERTEEADWVTFRPFTHCPNVDTRDPNLKFVDLTGDGHADIFISEDEAFCWHPSLAEAGFGPAERVRKPLDEEKGPRLVLANGIESIYLADLSGDDLADLVRIRNCEVCYWPNLGYGRFGAKVTMDHAPQFDSADQFDPKRIRLADIDGTGTTDIIYLHCDGVRLYFNQSGNSWSNPQTLDVFPQVDNLVSIVPTDLLGNGTACLVWSSPLRGDTRRPMRYIDLMGGQKPHLLVKTANNLGAETRVHYAPSTKFYLADKEAGKPWITRIPFPVHVVERVETYDYISRNRFVTRYAYHHGYFDGEEREFHGFGMVEQFDTEEFAALSAGGDLPIGVNIDAASHVPPVHTKTWFHTGVYVARNHISNFFAGLVDASDIGEYYREPGADDQQARGLLLNDTVLPDGLSAEEERQACRALKGAMLRQEVYADDTGPGATADRIQRARTPYIVTEQNFSIRMLQPRGSNRHAVFFTHTRETINYHYERTPADPRIQHALTLEVNDFGNVLKEAAIGYGRRQADMGLSVLDRAKQTQTLVTYTENGFTNPITQSDDYRAPLPAEIRTYELTGFMPENNNLRFSFEELTRNNYALAASATEIPYEQTANNVSKQKRLIEHVRTLYRKEDLTALLPLGIVEPLALPGESYKLAFTPGLLGQFFQRNGQPLLPDPSAVLAGQGPDRGGYVDLDGNGHWWTPSGRMFLSPNTNDDPATEFAYARQHFFLLHRYRDPFHTGAISTESFVSYDGYDLMMVETRDALVNTVRSQNDYRVLAPRSMTDPNGNRSQVAYDALGLVVGTAVMGKATENLGDLLDATFEAELSQARLDAFIAKPREASANANESVATQVVHEILGKVTTRIVYDLDRFSRTRKANPNDPDKWEPPFAAAIARETHVSDLGENQKSKLQISFSYSDGFGREIQKKVQAEPGPVPRRDPATGRVSVVNGRPEMTANDVSPRWVGSGWTVFNNKGKPVRQFEPFFTETHDFEFDVRIGVSPVLFYDPAERVIATLHPNDTYEKVVFDPWHQDTWDVNDTVLLDPRTDPDMGGYVAEYFKTQPATWRTWHAARVGGALGPHEQSAASRSALHANTPTIAYFDTLGRAFLTLAHNGFQPDGTPVRYPTRVRLDIEGNQREVCDAIVQNADQQGRIVMRYDYDMLGVRIHQASMEAGARWMLNDVTGKPIRAWDSRGHNFRAEYDRLRRPVRQVVRGTDANRSDPRTLNRDVRFEQIEYGENQPNDITLNLRSRVFRQYDGAGIVTNLGLNPATDREEAYDFKGNLLRSSRQLTQDSKPLPDWAAPPQMEAAIYRSSTAYDALNRPVALTMPDNSVVRPTYNEANLLERVEANLRGAAVATQFVTDIDYNAKGQRTKIEYGNGAITSHDYDRLTFRLTKLLATRTGFPARERTVQNLGYTYDPVGNITHLRDDADIQNVVFFRNRRVEPSSDYTYDAIYRLIKAEGREHIGQSGRPWTTYNDAGRVSLPHPSDGGAMRTYTELYEYDPVGNFERLIHQAANGNWRREYVYNEPSLIEPGKKSNRLSETILRPNGAQPIPEPYLHDAHGNMTRMPQLQVMLWDFKDQLFMTQRQAVDAGDVEGIARQGERTYCVYDAAGQRVRKITELPTGQVKDERIYLGSFEIYRKRGANPLTRETLHIMDDKQRVALVETRTQGNERGVPQQLIRYQLNNHLGSASLELDEQAQIISYEENYPYGSTSYQAVRSNIEVPSKRYRYTGKERDEETGLNYYGARYYAPWLARWTSCDPLGIKDGNNLYSFVRCNPIKLVDPAGAQPVELQAFSPRAPETTGVQALGFEKTNDVRYVASQSGRGLLYQTVTEFTRSPNLPVGSEGWGWGTYPAQFERSTGRFLGVGEHANILETTGVLRGRGLAALIWREHFQQYTSHAGTPPQSFTLDIIEERTVGQLSRGEAFETTKLGRYLIRAARSVRTQIDPSTVTVEPLDPSTPSSGYRVSGEFRRLPPRNPIGGGASFAPFGRVAITGGALFLASTVDTPAYVDERAHVQYEPRVLDPHTLNILEAETAYFSGEGPRPAHLDPNRDSPEVPGTLGVGIGGLLGGPWGAIAGGIAGALLPSAIKAAEDAVNSLQRGIRSLGFYLTERIKYPVRPFRPF